MEIELNVFQGQVPAHGITLLTLQMVTTTASNNPNCMETSICKHTEQLKSFMQGT